MSRLRLAFVVLLVLSVLAPAAYAEPDTTQLRQLESELETLRSDARAQQAALAETDERAAQLAQERTAAEERLEEIGVMLSEVVERYNEAQETLTTIQADRQATAEELTEVQAEAEMLGDSVADHARRLYRMGGRSIEFATVLSGDAADAGFRSTTLRWVLDGERANLEMLEANQERMQALELRLLEQEAAAEDAAAQVEEERVEVEATYDTYEGELTDLEATIARVEQEQAEERSELSAQQTRITEVQSELSAERDRVAAERARLEAEAEAERRREAERQRAAQRQAAASASTASSSSSSSSSSRPSSSSSPSNSSSGSSSPSPAPAPAPSARRSASVAVETALAQVGKPYVWGGTGPNGFDCSGLTSYAWAAAGVTIPRTSGAQFSGLRRVSRSELQPGDLVFYNSPISHVAMYVGGDTIVEASRRGVPVRTATLSNRNPVGYARP
ncbi:MAG: C40 family peptidase [Nitriliruptoraceae bacterium]|nr:C40 family peptidase [Nitriliruptoraceae bacterium]